MRGTVFFFHAGSENARDYKEVEDASGCPSRCDIYLYCGLAVAFLLPRAGGISPASFAYHAVSSKYWRPQSA